MNPDKTFPVIAIRLTVTTISISHDNALESIECKEAICPSCDDENRERMFFGKPKQFRKEEDIIVGENLKIVPSFRMRFKCRKE
jgi:hypothetical protein